MFLEEKGWLLPNLCLGRANLDLDVVAQPRQAVHHFAFRQIAEVAAHHVGGLGLSNAHALGGVLLCQATALHGFSDFDHQAGFDFQLIGVGQTKVSKYVAGTTMDFNAVNEASFHFRNFFTNASASFNRA